MNQIDKIAEQIAGRVKSDWQNAYSIACAVKKYAGNGGDRRTEGWEQQRNSAADPTKKVSAAEMARRIKEAAGGTVYGMGRDAIVAALEKWDEVAPQYGLPVSTDLNPEDSDNEPVFPDRTWKDDLGGITKVNDILSNPKATAAAMADAAFRDKVRSHTTDETNEAVIAEVVAAAPEVVAKAVAEDPKAAMVVTEAIHQKHEEDRGPRRKPTPEPEEPFNIMIGVATVSHATDMLIQDAVEQHPEGYGDSGEHHAKDVMRVVATLSAFADWLKNPSVPFHDPSAERFDITEGDLYVHDIVGHQR